MHHTAAALDLLRQGEVAKVGDTLAARRFIALHQSMLDASWNTARHLEWFPMEDASAAEPAAILATRKHAREVSKAQGILPLGGWGVSSGKGRGGNGRSDWSSFEPNPDKGKGKGKAKKGKGKWNQGSSSQWEKGQRDKDKTQDKGGEKPKCMTSLAKAVRVEEGASVPNASMLALPSFTDVLKACTSFPPR